VITVTKISRLIYHKTIWPSDNVRQSVVSTVSARCFFTEGSLMTMISVFCTGTPAP